MNDHVANAAASGVSERIAADRNAASDLSAVNDHAANGLSAPIVSRGRPRGRAKQREAYPWSPQPRGMRRLKVQSRRKVDPAAGVAAVSGVRMRQSRCGQALKQLSLRRLQQ